MGLHVCLIDRNSRKTSADELGAWRHGDINAGEELYRK
jgi:hypothetical protein